jgi:hypothetical protein
MSGATSGSESLHVSQQHRDEGITEMNDLFLLEPEFHYHANRARAELKPVRYRKWRRRLEWDGPDAATNEKNWIN